MATRVMSEGALSMKLDSWRGYSAYEIAQRHGYIGTEEEWLQSLKGEKGENADAITVNNKSEVGGNVTVRGTDILLTAGNAKTVTMVIDDLADKQESLDNVMAVTETGIDLKGHRIDNAIFG